MPVCGGALGALDNPHGRPNLDAGTGVEMTLLCTHFFLLCTLLCGEKGLAAQCAVQLKMLCCALCCALTFSSNFFTDRKLACSAPAFCAGFARSIRCIRLLAVGAAKELAVKQGAGEDFCAPAKPTYLQSDLKAVQP